MRSRHFEVSFGFTEEFFSSKAILPFLLTILSIMNKQIDYTVKIYLPHE